MAKKFGRFKSLTEENQYNDLKKRIVKSLGGLYKKTTEKAIPPEIVQVYTDMFFNMAKTRAANTNRSLESVLAEYEFATKKTSNAGGFVTTLFPGQKRLFIGHNLKQITDTDRYNTLIHEFGHVLLNNMIQDWDYIKSLKEEEMTDEQIYYNEMMNLTAKVLGVPNLKGVFERTKGGIKQNPIQEKFATSIELFFKEGKFKDTDTGRLMLRFQQLLHQHMTPEALERIGQSYVRFGTAPISPDSAEGKDAAIIFHSIIDANGKLIQEVYPLVPPPEFDRKDLGKDYKKWMNKYREAVEIALLKVYKELLDDNFDFYRTNYNEVYKNELDKLRKSSLGNLYNLLKDGYVILAENDLRKYFSKEELKDLKDNYGLKTVTNKKEATTNIDNLIEQGLLNKDSVKDDFISAVAIESTAAANTMQVLQESSDSVDHRSLQELSGIILSDEDMRKVRLEAGRIMKKKLIEELKSSENVASALKKELTKSLTNKAIVRKAKEKFLNTGHRFVINAEKMAKGEKDLARTRPNFAFNIFTNTSSTHIDASNSAAIGEMDRYLKTDKEKEEAKKRKSKEQRVETAIDTGEIPEIFDAVEKLLISERKAGIISKVNKHLNRLQDSWDSNMEKVKVVVKKEGNIWIYINEGMISTDAKGMEAMERADGRVVEIKDDGIYDLAKDIMDARKSKGVWSRLKYGHLMNEADLKARVLAKVKVAPDSKVDTKVTITPKEIKALMSVDKSPIGQADAMPLPPVTKNEVDISPTKKMKISVAHATVAKKIIGEVKTLKKARAMPSNIFTEYMYLNSIAMKNFIASMMDEKDLPNSLLYSIFQKVSEAESTKNTEQIKYHKRIVDAVRKYARSKKNVKQMFGTKPGIFSFLTGWTTKSDKVIKAPEIGKDVSFSNLGQVVAALLYMGSESGRRKLMTGGFINSEGVETGPLGVDNGTEIDTSGWDAFIQRLINEGVLNEQAFDFIQEVHDIFTEIYPLVKQSFIDVEGQTINFVEGRKYTVKFADGTTKSYNGGYYPLLPDRTLTPIVGADMGISPEQFSIVYDNLDSSMSKHRGGQIYPLQLGLGNIMGLLNKHLTHAYIKRPMMIVENLKKNKEIMQLLENRQRGFVEKVLNPWIARTTKQQFSVPGGSPFMNAIGLHFRRTAYIYLFLLKLGPIGKQFLGIVQAIPTVKQYVGTGKMLKHFLKVSASVSTGGYSRLKKQIIEQSAVMKDRLDNNERHLIRGWDELELAESTHGNIVTKTERVTFMGMQIAQNIVDMGIWLAAVERVKADGKTDAEAIAYADGLVERTQASGNISARPKAMHGTNWERLAMMITMVAHGLRGRLYENAVRAEDKGQSVNLARLNALTFMVIVPAIIEHAVSQALEQLGDDDEDKKDPEIPELMAKIISDTGGAFAPQIFQVYMPLLGGGLDTAIGAEGRGRGGEFFGLGPVANPLRKGQRGFTAMVESVRYGVPMTLKDWDNFFALLTLSFGIPASALTNLTWLLDAHKSAGQKKREAKKRRRLLDKAKKRR